MSLKGYPLPKQSPSAKDFINSKEFAEKHKAIKEQKKSVAKKMRPNPPGVMEKNNRLMMKIDKHNRKNQK